MCLFWPDEGTAGDYPTCVACRDAETSPSLTDFMRKLLEDTAQRAISYLESLEARSVAPLPEAVAKLSALDVPLPEAPTPPEHVIKQLDEICSPATTAMAGPRFFGFVHWRLTPCRLGSQSARRRLGPEYGPIRSHARHRAA